MTKKVWLVWLNKHMKINLLSSLHQITSIVNYSGYNIVRTGKFAPEWDQK